MKLRYFNNKKMNVPKPENLVSQYLNSEQIEFVWNFVRENGIKDEFILQIRKDKSVCIEGGQIDGIYYVEGSHWHEVSPLGSKMFEEESFWNDPKYNLINYNYFTNGQDLIPLIKEVTAFLNA